MPKPKETFNGKRDRERGRPVRRSPARQRDRPRVPESRRSPTRRGLASLSKQQRRRTRSRSPVRHSRQSPPKKLYHVDLDEDLALAQQRVDEIKAKKKAQEKSGDQELKASPDTQLESLRKDLAKDPSILTTLLKWSQSVKNKTDPSTANSSDSQPTASSSSLSASPSPASSTTKMPSDSSVTKLNKQSSSATLDRPTTTNNDEKNTRDRRSPTNTNMDIDRRTDVDRRTDYEWLSQRLRNNYRPPPGHSDHGMQAGTSGTTFTRPNFAHVNPAFLPRPMSASTRAQPPGLQNSQTLMARPPAPQNQQNQLNRSSMNQNTTTTARPRTKPPKDFRIPGQRKVGD